MSKTFTAFQGGVRVAAGTLTDVAEALREAGRRLNAVQVFDDMTGDALKLNSDSDVAAMQHSESRAQAANSMVTVEVRVLARDRDWLERQSGGPSAAVRRLVAAGRKDPTGRIREAQEAAYRFIAMLAGDFQGYEEACRALFAGDADRFELASATWPADVADHARRLGWPLGC